MLRLYTLAALMAAGMLSGSCGFAETRRRKAIQDQEEEAYAHRLDAWLNRQVSDYLISESLPTANVSEDGKGGKVYTWPDSKKAGALSMLGVGVGASGVASYSLFVDGKGKIYRWVTRDAGAITSSAHE